MSKPHKFPEWYPRPRETFTAWKGRTNRKSWASFCRTRGVQGLHRTDVTSDPEPASYAALKKAHTAAIIPFEENPDVIAVRVRWNNILQAMNDNLTKQFLIPRSTMETPTMMTPFLYVAHADDPDNPHLLTETPVLILAHSGKDARDKAMVALARSETLLPSTLVVTVRAFGGES